MEWNLGNEDSVTSEPAFGARQPGAKKSCPQCSANQPPKHKGANNGFLLTNLHNKIIPKVIILDLNQVDSGQYKLNKTTLLQFTLFYIHYTTI